MGSINSRITALLTTSRCSSRFELGTWESLKCTTQRMTGFFTVHGVVLGSSHLRGCVGARGAYHWHWPDLAREKCEAPLMTVAEPVCSVYVDNINVHGLSPESCDRRHEVIIAALEARGFRLHEISRASQQHKQPGVYFDGVACVLRHDPRPLWRVHLALRCLPRMGGARRPWVVRVLTGHLVHFFWLALPLLSARHRLYGFQAHPLDRWRKFSRADLAELRTLAGMVWLSECEVGRPFSHVVFCSDATLRRFCVQCTTASFKELQEPRDFVNGGVFEHEQSPIPCRFVTPMELPVLEI